VVECNLAKVEVAGSNPVSRSRKNECPTLAVGLFFIYFQGLKRLENFLNGSCYCLFIFFGVLVRLL
jgi:energy-converting hydrogenase Eha subunit E